MSEINWGYNFYFDAATLQPVLSPDQAIAPVAWPTYGSFGGPFFTEGVLTTSSGPVIVDEEGVAVDALDALFEAHDETGDDLALLEGVLDLKPNQLDAEGQFYAGVTALAFLVLAGSELSDKELQKDFREALHDVNSGLKHLPDEELIQLSDLLQINTVFLPFADAALESIAEVTKVHVPHQIDLLFA
jgi:hypothetical protein